jgi:hypothetical protein
MRSGAKSTRATERWSNSGKNSGNVNWRLNRLMRLVMAQQVRDQSGKSSGSINLRFGRLSHRRNLTRATSFSLRGVAAPPERL